MDRSNCWIVSAMIHVSAFGAVMVAAAKVGSFEWPGTPDGFDCRVSDSTAVFDRIDRSPDLFKRPGLTLDPMMPEERPGVFSTFGSDEDGGPPYNGPEVLYIEEGQHICYWSLRQLPPWVRIVVIPRPVVMVRDISNYLGWKKSFATTRKRGLRLPKGDQARHVLGLEVFCTCASRAQSPEEW